MTRLAQSMRSKIIVVSHPKSQSPFRWCAEHGTSKLDCSILTISELEKTCLSLTSKRASTIITIQSLLFMLKKCLKLFNLHLFTDHLTTYILFRLRQMSVDHLIRHSAPRGIVFFSNAIAIERFFYAAFADAGLKTAYVDFSLGYNIELENNLIIQFADFQRTPGFSVVFSRFRKEELLRAKSATRSLHLYMFTTAQGLR